VLEIGTTLDVALSSLSSLPTFKHSPSRVQVFVPTNNHTGLPTIAGGKLIKFLSNLHSRINGGTIDFLWATRNSVGSNGLLLPGIGRWGPSQISLREHNLRVSPEVPVELPWFPWRLHIPEKVIDATVPLIVYTNLHISALYGMVGVSDTLVQLIPELWDRRERMKPVTYRRIATRLLHPDLSILDARTVPMFDTRGVPVRNLNLATVFVGSDPSEVDTKAKELLGELACLDGIRALSLVEDWPNYWSRLHLQTQVILSEGANRAAARTVHLLEHFQRLLLGLYYIRQAFK